MKYLSYLLLLLVFASCVKQKKSTTTTSKPKLVVGIVVDQMRPDYIYRYWDKYRDGGFKKLIQNGFFYRNAHFDYVPTFTGPGHAAIYTGATPSTNGIIANHWYDKKSGSMVYCVEDKEHEITGNQTEYIGRSPDKLLSTTISDELRIASNFSSKVIGISLKDRGAILPAGKTANAAYWINENASWISSSYYMEALPEWVVNFNAEGRIEEYINSGWETILPIESYTESTADDNEYEQSISDGRPVFPYDLKTIAAKKGPGVIAYTPHGNTLVREFAEVAIVEEKLGQGEQTDLLAVSFSSTDKIGHAYGPQSIEIEDTYLRLDIELALFLDFLDKNIGRGEYLVFLTADHGAANVAAYMNDHDIEGGNFSSEQFQQEVNTFLKDRFGNESLLANVSNGQLFYRESALKQARLSKEELNNALVPFILDYEGVSNVFTGKELHAMASGDGILKLIQNGYRSGMSGDLIVVLNPGWMYYPYEKGTTHGSGYAYDTHVPLIWYGGMIMQGESNSYATISQVAPTLSLLLDIPFPNGAFNTKPLKEVGL